MINNPFLSLPLFSTNRHEKKKKIFFSLLVKRPIGRTNVYVEKKLICLFWPSAVSNDFFFPYTDIVARDTIASSTHLSK